MKAILVSSLLLLLNRAVVVTAQQQPTACLTEVDPDTDYFPTKVFPFASKNWGIAYFNTYKIVTNLAANETYLLYQCGSVPPQGEVDSGAHKAVIEIPVQTVGVDVTPTIPFLEQLGLVDTIVAFTSDQDYISSPCLLESIQDGNVIVLQSKADYDEYASSSQSSAEILAKLNGTVGFISPFNADSPFDTTVKVSEYTEKSNAAVFEWIKFYSLFFNLEAKANEVFSLTEERWDCVAANAELVTSDSPNKPVVLWAYYSDYCMGWDSGECPNYYCEYAQVCSATLISSTEGNFSETCGAVYLSTEQLVELGKDADHWIFPSENWNETYTLFKDQLDTMTSVKNKQVYDYQASGPNAWFEQRFPEYFAVLQDFCSIVGTSTSLAGKSWFRNVLDGSALGSVGDTCTEDSRANSIVPVVGAVCDDFTPPSTNNNATTNATKSPDNGAGAASNPTASTTNTTNKGASNSGTSGASAVALVASACFALLLASLLV